MGKATWKLTTRAAKTDSVCVCAATGCGRSVYYDGYCSEHWAPPVPATCGHPPPVVACGCCGRAVCADCYGHWKNLACLDCQDKARAAAP